MYDTRTRLSNQVAEEVRYFDDRVFKTVIARNVRLAEAPSFGFSHYFMIQLQWEQRTIWL